MAQLEHEAQAPEKQEKPYVSYLDKLREDPAKLAERLKSAGLPESLVNASNQEIRKAAIEAILSNKFPALDLEGMTIREFAHADHKY